MLTREARQVRREQRRAQVTPPMPPAATLRPVGPGAKKLQEAISKILTSKSPANLCSVLDPKICTTPGIGVPRFLMPNFTSTEDVNKFVKEMRNEGVKVEEGLEIDPDKLHNTQTNVVTGKVGAIIGWPDNPSISDDDKIKQIHPTQGPASPVLISKENFILDGHHRWASNKVYQILTGKDAPMKNLIRVDLPILDLIKACLNSSAAVLESDKDDIYQRDKSGKYKYVVFSCQDLTGKKDYNNRKPIGYVRDDLKFVDTDGKELGQFVEKSDEEHKLTGIYLS